MAFFPSAAKKHYFEAMVGFTQPFFITPCDRRKLRVHMIGNIGPAMYYARRNEQHVTGLQLDFA